MLPTERDPDRLAVTDCRVVVHGTDVHHVIDKAKRRGFSAAFITRIQDGKHIDVYQITGGVTIVPPESKGDPV